MPGVLNKRKAPSDALDDDDNEQQSDSSCDSLGSKRAHHVHHASRSVQGVAGEDDGHVYQPGSLIRIKLTNFVTYTAAEFHPGPSLNMIIGPNGTGKSTLVCAICLGLGWSPQHLGRAKEIGEYVKYGSADAEIEIELAASAAHTSNPIIRRIIKREGNKSAFFVNGRSQPQKEVVALARSFSIQIDNLCQFLPQDRVVEFSRLDPISLLRETQRAAAPEYMVQWHDKLKMLRAEQKSLEVQQQNEGEHLKNLQTKQNATREDVQRWNEREELITKSRVLEKVRPIISERILKSELVQIKTALQDGKLELANYQAGVEPARRAQVEMEKYRDQVEQVSRSRKNRFIATKQAVNDLALKLDTHQKSLEAYGTEIEAEKQGEKQRKQDIRRIEADIARLKLQREDQPMEYDQAAFDKKKSEIRNTRSLADREVTELSNELKTNYTNVHNLRGQLQRLRTDREHLNTQSGRQASELVKLSKDTSEAWCWLEKNMSSLQLAGQIYGPAILLCSVPNKKYADAIESQLRPGDLTAITCTNAADAQLLQNKLLGNRDGGLGLHHITIRTVPQPRSSYPSPLSKEELMGLGFEGWLIDYIEGPDPVLAMLCDSTKLHKAAFASVPITNEQYNLLQRSDYIQKWVSGSEVCQIVRRREYGASSTSVTRLREARYFTDQSSATEQMRQLDGQIREIESQIESKKELHKLKNNELRVAKEQIEEADNQKAQIQAEQTEMNKAYAAWEAIPRRIDAKQKELEELRRNSEQTRDRIRVIETKSEDAALEMAALALRYAEKLIQLRVVHEAYIEVEIRLIEARSEVDHFEQENQEIIRALKQKEAEVQALQNAKDSKNMEYRQVYSQAKRLIQSVTGEERDLIKEFKDLSSIEALEMEISAVESRLQLMHEGDPHAIKSYEEREQTIQKVQQLLAELDKKLEEHRDQIVNLREQWEPELDALVAQISQGFAHNFQQIGCAGQVGVHKDEEEFENWSIKIEVRFRENESLSILDSHRQSGGERAVSTIFYLMALQDLARSPFRVVDEINQGMDPRNERMVHERMVDIACREHTSQYFLVTPKLLNNLKFHPKMKVHCIASGEYMPDQKTNLNFQSLAKIALRVRRQAASAV